MLEKNNRKLQISVTNFITFQNKYLFLKRVANSWVDAGRLNGVGGKVEKLENFLDAAIRETKEETGYNVSAEDCKFNGFLNLEDGYPDDWLVAFFTIKVNSSVVPKGMKIPEGELVWLTTDELLGGSIELVDDLHYLFPLVAANEKTFFASARANSAEKIEIIKINTVDNNI